MAAPIYNVEGPWGGDGTQWTDGTYSRIRSITVQHKDVINAIKVEYVLKGENQDFVIPAPQHGRDGGNSTPISLDEDEYLTQIEGSFGEYSGSDTIITSLKFTTNKLKQHGPFGTEYKNTFQSSGKGKIVGFYGDAIAHLDCIGIYTLLN